MMGTGIAYTAALNGMNVTLIDKEIEVAKKGINDIDQILLLGTSNIILFSNSVQLLCT